MVENRAAYAKALMEADTPSSDGDNDGDGGDDKDGARADLLKSLATPAASCPRPRLPTLSSPTCTIETARPCLGDAVLGTISHGDVSSVVAPDGATPQGKKRRRDVGVEEEQVAEGPPTKTRSTGEKDGYIEDLSFLSFSFLLDPLQPGLIPNPRDRRLRQDEE